MLWAVGQKRLVREREEHLTDLFVAARDAALDVGVSSGQLKARGAWHLPSYVKTAEPRRTRQSRELALSKLAAMFPGIVQDRRAQ